MLDAPQLACVVLSLRDEPGLVAAVDSLRRQSEPSEIVVVNTGGRNPSKRLARAGLDVPVLHSAKPLYPGAARNLGIRGTRARYVAFLAADSTAAPGWTAGRLREHRRGAAAVSACMTSADRRSTIGWAGLLFLHHRRLRFTPPGVRIHYSLSYDRALFERLGFFREDLRAGEDTEFNARLGSRETVAWASDIVTAHRFPAASRALLRDAYRRGVLQAAMFRRLDGNSRRSTSRVALSGLLAGSAALRVTLRTPRPERDPLLRALPLVFPAGVAFAAGAVASHWRPFDDPTREAPAHG
jgi:glycosyltransferase involved in cell wall biosynthesis